MNESALSPILGNRPQPGDRFAGRGAPSAAARDERGPRHLLHVFPNFDIGGAQVRFAALAEGLGDRFRHTVVSLKGSYAAAALLSDTAPVRLQAPPLPGPWLSQMRAHRSTVRRLKPDAVVTYNWGSMEFVLATLPQRTAHIHFEDGFGPEEALRRLPRRSWTRRLALRRSHIVVPSRSLQAVAERDWRLDMRRVHYIPNGIASRTSRPRVRTELGLGLPPHLLRIIWVGALRPEKNPLRMIRAFAQLKARAALLIVGDGSQGEAVRQEVDRLGLQERVRLLGARTDTRDLIMQCDVLALTSDTEQMPLVVLEAMDAGLAIAASDVGDIRFMVSEENRPFIVSPTEADLAGALTNLLADEARRRTIGQANRVRLLSVYRLEQMIDAYRHLFDQVAPPRERRAAHG